MKKVKQSETTKLPSENLLPVWIDVDYMHQIVQMGNTTSYESMYIPFDKITAVIHELKKI